MGAIVQTESADDRCLLTQFVFVLQIVIVIIVKISSVVTVIAADIATAVDSFHRITTATAVAIDLLTVGVQLEHL